MGRKRGGVAWPQQRKMYRSPKSVCRIDLSQSIWRDTGMSSARLIDSGYQTDHNLDENDNDEQNDLSDFFCWGLFVIYYYKYPADGNNVQRPEVKSVLFAKEGGGEGDASVPFSIPAGDRAVRVEHPQKRNE